MIGVLSYLIFFASTALILAVVVLGLNLQWGATGLFNAGIVGFFAVGAYGFAILTAPAQGGLIGNFGLPWLVGVVGSMAVSAAAALVVGVATLKLRDDYLAIATFGIASTIQLLALNAEALTGGPIGIAAIPNPARGLSAWPMADNLAYLALVAAIVAAVYAAQQRILASPWGRALRAIREDEVAAQTLGKDVGLLRLQAFVLGAVQMGLGGALYAGFVGFIGPADFAPILTFQIWTMLIIGGSGSNAGAILGAVLVWGLWSLIGGATAAWMPARLQVYGGALQALIIGLILVLTLLLRPRGLIGERMAASRHAA